MKHKKIVISIIVSLILILSLTVTGVFAYFTLVINKDSSIKVQSNDTAGRINVTNYSDLFKYSSAEYYNDNENISNGANRHTLVFANDITLENNLFITADCHIDLGNHVLNLNGYSLTFTHGYEGNIVLENGNINPCNIKDPTKSGKIVFDVIKATPIINNVTFTDGQNTLLKDDCVKELNLDAKYTAYNALYYIGSSLINNYEDRLKRLTYDEVLALTTVDFSSIINKKSTCEFTTTHTAEDCCVYVGENILLPNYYLSSDVKITYTADRGNFISSGGFVDVTNVSNIETVKVQVTVDVNGTTTTASIVLHLFNKTNVNQENALKIAKSIFFNNIEQYYNTEKNKHVFDRGVYLSTNLNEVLDCTLSYKAFSDNPPTKEILYEDVFKEVIGNANIINFESTGSCVILRVTFNVKGNNTNIDIPMESGNSALIKTNASIAKDIVNGWYGGSIDINPSKNQDDIIIGYTEKELRFHDQTFKEKYNITNVEYELMNNSNNVYQIYVAGDTKTYIRVAENKNPADFVQGVMLNCKFTFTDGEKSSIEQIQVPIIYKDTGMGTNANGFLPYYTYYNELLFANLAGATTKTFEIPFCFGNKGPIICYDVMQRSEDGKTLSISLPSCMQIHLFYNGAIKTTLKYDETPTYLTEKLDTYLSNNNIDLNTIIGFGDAKWIFEIDTNQIPNTNTPIELAYNYKMTANDMGWTLYTDDANDIVTSPLTILGILNNTKDVPDERLYRWIYDTYNINSDTYGDGTGKYIVTDWLKQNIEINKDSGFPWDADLNFKGIEFLVGTKNLDLFDPGVPSEKPNEAPKEPPSGHPALKNPESTDMVAKYISQMSNLENLNLQGCAFRDRVSATTQDMQTVSSFSNLKKLKKINLRDNGIFSFEWMVGMTSLEEVYVGGNNALSVDGNKKVECVFYGSEGIVNYSAFQQLIDIGIKVYNNTGEKENVLFEDSGEINDYIRLKSIEYQKKIKTGTDISTIWTNNLSVNPEDYALSTNTNGIDEKYEHQLAFVAVGNPTTCTQFKLVDSITVAGGLRVVIEIVFNVIRV